MKTIKASGVGNPIDRIEGHLKVTGKAKYASEFPVENMAYAQGVNSTIAKGKIKDIDASVAENLDGVIKVITFKNAEKLKNYSEEMTSFSRQNLINKYNVRIHGNRLFYCEAITY